MITCSHCAVIIHASQKRCKILLHVEKSHNIDIKFTITGMHGFRFLYFLRCASYKCFKHLKWHSRSLKVIDIGAFRYATCDSLLMFHCRCVSISYISEILSRIFGRHFVKRFPLWYQTVVCLSVRLSVLSVLSVCLWRWRIAAKQLHRSRWMKLGM